MTEAEQMARDLMADVAKLVADTRDATVEVIEGRRHQDAFKTLATEGYVRIYATIYRHLTGKRL